jgi:hypothetical protein
VDRSSVVGIVNAYGLDDRGVGVRIPVWSRILTSPHHQNRLWGLPNLLFNEYQRLFPRGESGRRVKLTTHLELVPRSRKHGSIHPLPHTPSWRNAELVRHSDTFSFLYISVYCCDVTMKANRVTTEIHDGSNKWQCFVVRTVTSVGITVSAIAGKVPPDSCCYSVKVKLSP